MAGLGVLLDVLFDLLAGLAWIDARANDRRNEPAPRQVLVRWRYDDAAWRRHVDAISIRDRRRARRLLTVSLAIASLVGVLSLAAGAPIALPTVA